MEGSAARRLQPLHAVRAPAPEFVVYGEALHFETQHALEFIDITSAVQDIVARSGVEFGQVAVTSSHTTAAVICNEHEPGLLNDMARVLSRVVPAGSYYEHNDFAIRTVNMTERECANGHAHCQQLFLGASETLPVHEGRARIGHWQSLFLVELDHPRDREVFVQVFGIGSREVDVAAPANGRVHGPAPVDDRPAS